MSEQRPISMPFGGTTNLQISIMVLSTVCVDGLCNSMYLCCERRFPSMGSEVHAAYNILITWSLMMLVSGLGHERVVDSSACLLIACLAIEGSSLKRFLSVLPHTLFLHLALSKDSIGRISLRCFLKSPCHALTEIAQSSSEENRCTPWGAVRWLWASQHTWLWGRSTPGGSSHSKAALGCVCLLHSSPGCVLHSEVTETRWPCSVWGNVTPLALNFAA